MIICNVLHDLLPFVQFKKRENTQWSMLLLEKLGLKPATLLKVALLHGCFHIF